MLDFSARLKSCSSDEPSLREIVTLYYTKNIQDREMALQYAQEWCAQFEDALGEYVDEHMPDIYDYEEH